MNFFTVRGTRDDWLPLLVPFLVSVSFLILWLNHRINRGPNRPAYHRGRGWIVTIGAILGLIFGSVTWFSNGFGGKLLFPAWEWMGSGLAFLGAGLVNGNLLALFLFPRPPDPESYLPE